MIQLKDIKFRIGTSKATKDKAYATCLIYIDARTAMDELDAKFGQFNWKFSWERVFDEKWGIKGILEIRNPNDKLEWVKYEDVGYPQDEKKKKDSDSTEWLKDAVSDALKRCTIHVGIGRELYDAPFLYTEEVEVYEWESKWYVKKLTKTGEQMIQGKINDWYSKLNK